MKIAIVCNNYLPFIGGVETHIRQIAEHLSREHDVRIAAMNFKQSSRLSNRMKLFELDLLASPASDRLDGNVKVIALGPRRVEQLMMLPLLLRAAPLVQRKFYHFIRRATHPFYRMAFKAKVREAVAGVDVIHCMSFGDLGWLTIEIAKESGIPIVVTPFVHPRQWGDGPNDSNCYKNADAVIGLVKTDCDYVASLGVNPNRIHEIGVSPDLNPTHDALGFRDRNGIAGNPMVLYIGRMMPQKGAAAVFGAARQVIERMPNTRFVFAGPGSPEEVAMFKDCDPRILYLGKISSEDKASALAACDLFCMPSMSEILPTVYLEAWSLGKPVIGGLAHGLMELIEGNQAGRVVGQDATEVAQALCSALGDSAQLAKWGENGRRLVESSYSTTAIVDKLLNLYRKLISEPSSSRKEVVCVS